MADDTESDPRDFTARFNTPLAPAAESRFQDWMATQSANTGRDVSRDLYDYDLRGFWREHPDTNMGDAHLTDEFKKPNHPTFSTNSRYHGAEGMQGGQWGKSPDGSWTFTPGESNVYSRDELRSYFDRVEPGNKLLDRPQSSLSGRQYAMRTDVTSDADLLEISKAPDQLTSARDEAKTREYREMMEHAGALRARMFKFLAPASGKGAIEEDPAHPETTKLKEYYSNFGPDLAQKIQEAQMALSEMIEHRFFDDPGALDKSGLRKLIDTPAKDQSRVGH